MLYRYEKWCRQEKNKKIEKLKKNIKYNVMERWKMVWSREK